MLRKAQSVVVLILFPSLAEAPVLDADICIVGAGAAGIAMAVSLIGTKQQVCLLESGGLEPDQATQSLAEGESVGLPWGTGLATARSRFFGGTTNQWPGGCVPLDAMDFQERSWVPYSGWPICRADLDPWYACARALLRVSDVPPGWREPVSDVPPFAFDPERLVHCKLATSQALRLGKEHRSALARAENVRVLLRANLTSLETNPSADAVLEARIRSLDGRSGRVRARNFVLACGGIENARLLLLSDSVVRQGLGNQHDLVGRFFMDHPTGKLGTVASRSPDRLSAPYNRQVVVPGVPRPGEICVSSSAQRKERLLNARVRPQDYEVEDAIPDGVRAARQLNAELRRGQWRGELPQLAWRMGADVGQIVSAAWRRLCGRPAVPNHRIDLEGFFEQAPNPDSRITLSPVRDAIGLRRVQLDWRLTDLDRRTYRAAAGIFSSELTRLELGELQLEPWLRCAPVGDPCVAGTAHHMGTTRMADDPRRGVVDRNCRVHGMHNLYVAGSSVFPTGGWALPTFTIVALALRLADHLQQNP